MKYKKNGELTKAGIRITRDFRQTLLKLVTEKSFEKISVQEICHRAGYPRATFYNYFEDKYDLLENCFMELSHILQLEDHVKMQPAEAIEILFGRVYDFFYQRKDWITELQKFNTPDSLFWTQFEIFSKREFRKMFETCMNFQESELPLDMISQHYSNTIFLLLDRVFLKRVDMSKTEAQSSLKILLKAFI